MSTTPLPTYPWAKRKRDRGIDFSVLAISILISWGLVEGTGLKGKLGFFSSFFFVYLFLNYAAKRITRNKVEAKDAVFSTFALFGIILTLIPIISIVSTVVVKGYKGLHLGLLTHDMALNSVNDPITSGGLLHALTGTIIMVGGALIISLPLGILTALYLTEIKGRFARPVKFLVQALSGVPSIVAGLFILSSLVYPITKSLSGFMGSLALSILMIPTIARTSEEMLLLIPQDLREAGVALGGTQWRTVAGVVLPAAKSGLLTATILGVARVIGETAPLLLVSGGADATNLNPFHGPMGSLPYYIWKAFLTGGTDQAFARAWAGMLILLIFIFILFGTARYLGRSSKK